MGRLTPLSFLAIRGIELGRQARRERAQSAVDRCSLDVEESKVVDERSERAVDELEVETVADVVVEAEVSLLAVVSLLALLPTW